MQGVAAKNDASYDLSRARASVTGQTTIAASTATTSLPNGRIVTRGLRRMPKPLCDYLDLESRAFCARCSVTNSFINRKASRPLRS